MAKGDPIWITTKYGGKCAGEGCGRYALKGEKIYYVPVSKSIFCEVNGCGQRAEKELDALMGK